ncbi:aminoglycoside phosphotransferase family protein [Mesorhizobium sp. WSM4904]|nr:aminoglycoside phosphotransferase family protein [Mesorhizobium sp. WSM4904]WFP66143.1 aminoglycoside phosphotransferase family protein [Mesorhizobium sp. WSM4904]
MMHSDQVHIDADIVRDMISAQFPQYRHQRIEPLGAIGTVNAIFRIGSSVAARFPLRFADPIECVNILNSEAAAMAEFARHSPFAAPRPLGIGRPGPRYPMPWTLQSWIDGDAATPDGLANSASFALDIAGLIASLRAADTRGRRFDRRGRGGHLPDHDDWMSICFRNSEDILDVPRLRRKWGDLRELPPSGPDVMNHGDLIPANLLVRGERLVGVLDCGSFGPADPALDLVAAWHLLDRDRRETVRIHLRSSTIEWKRGAAWAFQQAMGLVWYYQNTNPAMSALGRSTLRRILDDPEI